MWPDAQLILNVTGFVKILKSNSISITDLHIKPESRESTGTGQSPFSLWTTMKLVSSSQGYRDESHGETGIGPEPGRRGVTPSGSSAGLS